ncbi:MAG: PKD domain-containing protein [Thermoplasmata archaeon]|nr:PKD domain-containing protein [Actinomycetota bacterium]MBE3139599.1 PKD domain-containing protein [Thermoplasmata archaeon]
MNILQMRKYSSLAGILLAFVLFIGSTTILVQASDPTIVQVIPFGQTVSAGQTFTINISCTPGQPIKSFELKVSFNPSLLQANSVTEGNIFHGYTTFFSNGIINNIAGTIINIYNLIMGPDCISDPGSFVSISFTAKSLSGTSTIDLYAVGVTNAVGYVTISVSDGSVTVLGGNQPPVFSGISLGNGTTGVSIGTPSLSLMIRDPEGDLFNWSITTIQNIGSNIGISATNGSKACGISGLAYSTTYHWYISCKDVGSKQWKNASYWFTTESEPTGGNPPGGGGYTPPGETEENGAGIKNNPPDIPTKPMGPTLIERGVTYTYTSSASDPDGDQVRLRFDWGNGTLSNWSPFFDSNTSISSSYSWNSISTYSIRVIAQDENGTNSSWSPTLSVTISETNNENESPIPNINAPGNASSNHSILFDASGSYDPDGVIVSYFWDFGDGEIDTSKNPIHTYKNPGQYTVTLTVTDSSGITSSKSIVVTVAAGVEASDQNKHDFLAFPINVILIGTTLAIAICLMLFFRNKKKLFLTKWSIVRQHKMLEQLDAETAKLSHAIEQKSITKKYSTREETKKSISHESSEERIEKKVDDVLFSKMLEKIDKM